MKAQAAATVILALALLSGCNTTDALTPPMELTGEPRRSPPVTQADAARMAASPTSDADRGYGAYQAAPLPPVTAAQAPERTLEEQARSVDAGGTSPSASPPLDPSAQSRAQAATSQQQTQAEPSPATPTVAGANGSIRFMPVIGGPVEVVTPLSRQLGAAARTGGLTIKSSDDTSSDYTLKGYLSAFEDEGQISVVYVWDVLDNMGNRQHRIQGQEKVPASTKEPWASVPAATMETIGNKTISEYLRWRQAGGG